LRFYHLGGAPLVALRAQLVSVSTGIGGEHDLGDICPRIGCRQVQSTIEFQRRVQNGMIAAPTRIRLETQLDASS
jgi:hypothetical protein